MYLFRRLFCAVAVSLISVQLTQGRVVISEIMYHPASELTAEEYIELQNVGTNSVDLQGWQLTQGVAFTFSNSVILPPDGIYVVVADTNAFHAKYPTVSAYTGNWTGTLNNQNESIRIKDASGNVSDDVSYADEGDYAIRVRGALDFTHRGWTWVAEHDGLGKSLERINPLLTGNAGANWAASIPANGTPGLANSTASANIAPLIGDVTHFPLIPHSTNTITFSARLTDELTNGLSATLFWRNASVVNAAAFTSAAMFDDGAHGDGLSGDRLFGAVIPAQANGTVIEFYVQAADATAHSRTWPAAALETNGVPIQACNALLQVDDNITPTDRPSYRLIMTESERAELASIPPSGANSVSHAEFNGTFVAVDGVGTEARYNCSFRNRGAGSADANPPNYRVNIPTDRRWKGVAALNLNSQFTHSQLAGYAVAASAGLTTEQHRRVQLRVNSTDMAGSGLPQFGSYIHQEAVDTDMAANHFPADGNGNLYRGTRFPWTADLSYQGTNWQTYTSLGYYKNSNGSENDWTDLIHLTDVLNNTPDVNYWTQLQTVANVRQWVRYFAVFSLLGSRETALATGAGDDYSMYRGILDPRFQLVGHDFDTVLNQGDTAGDANQTIFGACTGLPISGGTPGVPAINRFLKHPEVAPLYYEELLYQLAHTFTPANMAALLDQSLGDWVAPGNIAAMKTYATNRYAGALAQIPLTLTLTGNLPAATSTNGGVPRFTSPALTIFGHAHAAKTRSVRVNGQLATWSAWEAHWTNTVTLQPGVNNIRVESLDSNNVVFASTNLSFWYDNGVAQNVSGTLASDAVWSPASGPYVITGTLTVPNGVSLTIQPGTSVYLASGVNLVVANGGRILAEGTASAGIRFAASPGSGTTWGGITINGGAGSPESRFAWVTLEGNNNTCIIVAAGTVLLDHLTFLNTTKQCLALDDASFLVRDCFIPSGTAQFEPVHGTVGIKAGGRGIFLRNYFGATLGYNDTIDFTGGNREFGQPIVQFLDNVFAGSGDDMLDLDGTDAWVEGNIFLHAHKNGSPDSSSAISGGNTGSDTSQITVVRNYFFDCDQAATAKQGNFYTLLNNTIVHTTKTGGSDTASAVINLGDDGTTLGAGMYLEGNIITDAEALTRNYTNGFSTVTFSNNILPVAWSGPGGGNTVTDPHLKYIPTLAEAQFSSWQDAQIVKQWFAPTTGSPASGSGPNGQDKGASAPLGVTLSGEPPAQTPRTSATLTVGTLRTGNGIPTGGFPNGSGFTHYQWRLDGGAWSAETPTATPITLAGLANGAHQVEARGKRDSGLYQDAVDYAPSNPTSLSRVWTVNAALPGVRLNEILARNSTALVTNGVTPDVIELFNAGSATVDLSGMGLTDDPLDKYRFTIAPGTSLAPGQFLVLYFSGAADAALNTGLGIGPNGGTLQLYAASAAGGALLDTVTFGLQIPDQSIGRLADGNWALCAPTFGLANVAAGLGDARRLRINEWLADGNFQGNDWIELFNPDALPVALGGLFLTDVAESWPTRHAVAPLSFVSGAGFAVFTADGNTNSGAEHLNFSLSPTFGSIALYNADVTLIDFVEYFAQTTDVSMGRTPNGGSTLTFFNLPTRGAGNPGSLPSYVTSTNITLMAYTNTWRFNQSNNLDAVNWKATNYNDSTWQSGRGLLAFESLPAIVPLINTTLLDPRVPPAGLSAGHAYYFRTTLVVTNDLTGYTLNAQMRLDDCGVIYINGVEFSRPRMPAGTITNLTFGGGAVGTATDADVDELFTIPASLLHLGTNIIAVEVHQISATSSDIVWGMALDATRYLTNFPSQSVVLSEVLAANDAVTNADGTVTDWVELFNPSASSLNLAGYSLTDDSTQPQRWVFPSGVSLNAGARLVVRCDSSTNASLVNASVLNTGFGLSAAGDQLFLYAPGATLIDAVSFGPQAVNFSLGRVPENSSSWTLNLPTPGSLNLAASLGNVSGIRINEWAASVNNGPDWFELYNQNVQPVALSGLFLTDKLATPNKHAIPPLSFIGVSTNGYVKFIADNNTAQGPDHVGFTLDATGEAIGLFPPGTAPAIDSVTFYQQTPDVSEGCFPDGATNHVFFTKPSPGAANWLYLTNIVINEVLSHTDLPLEDAIELRNLTAAPVDVSGWLISDDIAQLRKFRIPDGTIIPANGFKVFYEKDFNAESGLTGNFTFNSFAGDDAWLTAVDGGGTPTGYRDYAKFGPSFNGYSFGRHVTSVGVDFPAQSALTFGTGVTAQSPTNQITVFRTGTGAANAYPRIGPVVISEIQYHPLPIGTNDNTRDEFIELQNVTGATLPLYDPLFPTNGWKLRDAVDFVFNTNHSIPAGGFLVVVSFDPATNAVALAAFRASYGTNGLLVGPWSGKLDNGGESVELVAPDHPQTTITDFGLVPYVLVDRVVYADAAPWPANADGFGMSLQRVSATSYGNDPVNWIAAAPNAGMSGLMDTDGDGLPDVWEDANGLNKLVNDASLDPDGDGFTNLQEFTAGTNPQSAASRLKIESVVSLAGGAQISFLAASNRTYSVLYRNSLSAGVWNKLADVAAQPATQLVTVPDGSGIGQSVRFYRLVTPATP